MEVLYNLPALYLLAINIATFSAFGADKRRARRESWRIPEKTLFLLSLLGGSAGALLGMRIFHHKTSGPEAKKSPHSSWSAGIFACRKIPRRLLIRCADGPFAYPSPHPLSARDVFSVFS